MKYDKDKPGWWQLVNGRGEPHMVLIARGGSLLLLFVYAFGLIAMVR